MVSFSPNSLSGFTILTKPQKSAWNSSNPSKNLLKNLHLSGTGWGAAQDGPASSVLLSVKPFPGWLCPHNSSLLLPMVPLPLELKSGWELQCSRAFVNPSAHTSVLYLVPRYHLELICSRQAGAQLLPILTRQQVLGQKSSFWTCSRPCPALEAAPSPFFL